MHRQAETRTSVPGATREHVTLPTTRTHIAVVCDDAALQPRLPQVIIANTKTILCRELPRLITKSAPNARLVRRQTSWNTAGLQEQVIGWLRGASAALYGPLHTCSVDGCCDCVWPPTFLERAWRRVFTPLIAPALHDLANATTGHPRFAFVQIHIHASLLSSADAHRRRAPRGGRVSPGCGQHDP